MAIEIHEEESDDVIDVRLSGILFREDYRNFLLDLAGLAAAHAKARLLVTMQNFYGWAAGVCWDEIKCAPELFQQIERIAVVGDARWKAALRVFCTPFLRARTRFFYLDMAADAKAWVHQKRGAMT